MSAPLVEMNGISKFYGRVRALEDVHLTVGEREIVGLLGDNGAGKSTLIKILSGAVPPAAATSSFAAKKPTSRTQPTPLATALKLSIRTRLS